MAFRWNSMWPPIPLFSPFFLCFSPLFSVPLCGSKKRNSCPHTSLLKKPKMPSSGLRYISSPYPAINCWANVTSHYRPSDFRGLPLIISLLHLFLFSPSAFLRFYMKNGTVNVPFTSITWICAKRDVWHSGFHWCFSVPLKWFKKNKNSCPHKLIVNKNLRCRPSD